jgi:hypothetical protein
MLGCHVPSNPGIQSDVHLCTRNPTLDLWNRVSAVMTLALNELSQCGIFGALRFPPWKMAFLDPKQSTFLGQKWDPAAWQWSKMDSHHHDPYGSYGSYGPQNGMSCHWCFKLTALGGPTHFPK